MLRPFVFAVLLATSLVPLSYAQAPEAATAGAGPDSVKVTVTGIRSAKGRVRVELWSSEAGFPRQTESATKTVWLNAMDASDGTVTTTFTGLQPGAYAFTTMHDENNNGRLDTGAFGVPKEGWAVSNNVVSHTRPPKFEEAKIVVNSPDQETTLKLHY